MPQDEFVLIVSIAHACKMLHYHVQPARNVKCRALLVLRVLCPSKAVTQGQMVILIGFDAVIAPARDVATRAELHCMMPKYPKQLAASPDGAALLV